MPESVNIASAQTALLACEKAIRDSEIKAVTATREKARRAAQALGLPVETLLAELPNAGRSAWLTTSELTADKEETEAALAELGVTDYERWDREFIKSAQEYGASLGRARATYVLTESDWQTEQGLLGGRRETRKSHATYANAQRSLLADTTELPDTLPSALQVAAKAAAADAAIETAETIGINRLKVLSSIAEPGIRERLREFRRDLRKDSPAPTITRENVAFADRYVTAATLIAQLNRINNALEIRREMLGDKEAQYLEAVVDTDLAISRASLATKDIQVAELVSEEDRALVKRTVESSFSAFWTRTVSIDPYEVVAQMTTDATTVGRADAHVAARSEKMTTVLDIAERLNSRRSKVRATALDNIDRILERMQDSLESPGQSLARKTVDIGERTPEISTAYNDALNSERVIIATYLETARAVISSIDSKQLTHSDKAAVTNSLQAVATALSPQRSLQAEATNAAERLTERATEFNENRIAQARLRVERARFFALMPGTRELYGTLSDLQAAKTVENSLLTRATGDSAERPWLEIRPAAAPMRLAEQSNLGVALS